MNLTGVKMRGHIFLAAILLLSLLGCSGENPVGPREQDAALDSMIDQEVDYLPGELLLQFSEPSPDSTELDRFFDENSLSLIEVHEHFWGTFYQLKIDDTLSVPDKCSELIALPSVEVAEPNYLIEFDGVKDAHWPNDPLWESAWDVDDDPGSSTREMWGPHLFGADLVWPDVTGYGVVLAIIDTGVNSHEDLDPNLWTNEDEIPGNFTDDDNNGFVDDIHGWDFDGGDADYSDPGYSLHGTSTSSIALARGDNGLGLSGTAPRASLMCVRVDLSGGGSFISTVADGINYAQNNEADIMSMSFGTTNYSSIMQNACDAAYDDGIVMVASAGNAGNSAQHYPSDYESVISVGACTSFGPDLLPWESKLISEQDFYWGSSYGNNTDVVAPGIWYIAAHGIGYSSYETGQTEDSYFGGTSCSSPFTAGTIALIMEAFPGLTPAEYRIRLKEAADDMGAAGDDFYYGNGRVNIFRAILGSDPNSDLEDVDGIVPIKADDVFHDNLNPNPDGDFDEIDYFKYTALDDLALPLSLEILNWGKDLILEVYDNPALIGEPVAASDIVNGAPPSNVESLILQAASGNTYYIVVKPKSETDCTTYKLTSEGDITSDAVRLTLESSPLTNAQIGPSAAWVGTLTLEALTGQVYMDNLTMSLQGNLPVEFVNGFSLYMDADQSGTFDKSLDALHYTSGSFDPVNRSTVSLNGLKVKFDKPKEFFVTLEIDMDAPEDKTTGIGLVTYKDVLVMMPNYVDHTNLPQMTDLKTTFKPGILFVDDDGEDDWELYYFPHLNSIGLGYEVYEVGYGEDGPNLGTMQSYQMVLWTTGGNLAILSSTDRNNINSFLSSGGRLLFVSRDLGWEADIDGYTTWLANVMHAVYNMDDSEATLMDGVPGDPISDGISGFSLFGGLPYAAWWFDECDPVGGAVSILTYANGSGGNAGLRYEEDNSRLVYLFFPIATMGEYDERQLLLERCIAWLTS